LGIGRAEVNNYISTIIVVGEYNFIGKDKGVYCMSAAAGSTGNFRVRAEGTGVANIHCVATAGRGALDAAFIMATFADTIAYAAEAAAVVVTIGAIAVAYTANTAAIATMFIHHNTERLNV
jgi:hypothetical protein